MAESLEGIRVVDFGHYLAGPAVGMMLADLGADVVKVDPPGGPRWKAPVNRRLMHRKILREIDLKTAEGLSEAQELIGSADVVVENFRPGVMARLGLDQVAICRAQPRLVWLSLPGFPADDELRAATRAFEGILCAAAGVFAERGPSHALRGKGPAFVPMPMASAYGAAFGTLAVMVALYARGASGCGERIEVPLFHALLEGLSYNHLKLHGLPERYVDWRGMAVRQGCKPPLPEAEVQRLIDPLYRSYRCADGRWYYLATPAHRRLVEGVLRHFGIWDNAIAEGLGTDDAYLSSCRWQSRENGSIYGPPRLSQEWVDRIGRDLTAAFAQKNGDDVERELAEAGLCGAVVRRSTEWMDDPHAIAAGLIEAGEGHARQPGPFVWFPGQDAPARIQSAKRERGPLPLSGLTILDLANVIAGPTVAGSLARFGARIIKIDDTRPNFDPFITVVLGLQAGRGKESLLLDLKSEDGYAVFRRLACKADLVTYNGTDKQVETLGIDTGELKAINPGLCLTQVGAFGGPRPGPMTNFRGVDEVLQAATGVMARMTPAGLPPEEYAHFGTIDVLTGICGAIGAMAALIMRDRAGIGEWVATSLAAGGALVQLPFMVRGPDGEVAFGAHDPDGLGEGPVYRIYRTKDGFAFIAGPDLSQADLELTPDEIEGLSTADLRARLEPKGFAIQPLLSYAGLRETEPAFIRHIDHPLGFPLDLVSQCAIRFAGTALRQPPPHPQYGSGTRSVLASFGFPPSEIEALIASGAIAERWPNHETYLPD